jgi:phage-related protein
MLDVCLSANVSARFGRVLFCISGDEMVLLHGFIKKSQKTPEQDLELALKRKQKLENQAKNQSK